MDPSSIASAYLSSLVHSPGSHFISLEYRPSQQLTRSDLSVWMEGFRCAYKGDIALPATDEVLKWVEVALKRFFEWEEQQVEQVRVQAAAAQSTTVSEQIKPQPIKPEQAVDQTAAARIVAAAERKKSPRPVSVPGLRLGLCGTLAVTAELALDVVVSNSAAVSTYQA